MKYNHKENQIDPRDKHLVSYFDDTQTFVVDESDLKALGIEPKWHTGIVHSYYYLHMWSSKFNRSILYKQSKHVRNNDNEIIGTIFIPLIDGYTEESVKGTELCIIND